MPGASDALGPRIRAAREARGLSLSDVAEQIRIRSVYLAAIEEESWSTIGAPVYIRGFLRTYARFLGMDPEEAVVAFNRTQPAAPSGTGNTSRESVERDPAPGPGSLLLWVAGAIAVVLIAFVVYNELTMRRSEVASNPASSVTPSVEPSSSAAPTPAATPPSPTQPPPIADGPKSLALVLSAPSWLRVTVDGNVSMEGTFPAGTSKTFHGKNALVRIGNAGGVEVYVDGRDVGKLGKSGDVVEHAFTL